MGNGDELAQVNSLSPPFPACPPRLFPAFFPSCSMSHRAEGRNRFGSPLGQVPCVRARASAPECPHPQASPAPIDQWSVLSLPKMQVALERPYTPLWENTFSSCGGTQRGGAVALWRDSESPPHNGKGRERGPHTHAAHVPRAQLRSSEERLRVPFSAFRLPLLATRVRNSRPGRQR